jgi:two-component system, NarL family, response regulator NreC
MTAPFRVILADDHAMFRVGVRKILQDIDGVEVVGEASDGLELLEILKQTSPHLAILDISMPNLRGLEATFEINVIAPNVKVLILTMHDDKEYLYQALKAGAQGYLLKEDTDRELLIAIETLRKGGTYVSPLLAPQLTELFMQRSRPGSERPGGSQEPLTVREREIIKLIAEGKSGGQISELLFISDRTVQHHRENLKRKLNIKTTAELIRYAMQKGYIFSGWLLFSVCFSNYFSLPWLSETILNCCDYVF